MKFYISNIDIDRIEKRCDLGDSVEVSVYLYPHTDSLSKLTECFTKENTLFDWISDPRIFAESAHKTQKYGIYPYSYHLQQVYDVLISFGETDKELLCASWLHDVLEDTSIIYDELKSIFGVEVADIVLAVTNEEGKNRWERNMKTYPKIKKSLKATKLKLADRIANVEQSKLNNLNLFEMYKREYPSFKEEIKNHLFTESILNQMWEKLDSLLL